MKAKKHVCTECGHEEIRSLAPAVCPSCDSEFVIDDEAIDDEELDEDDVTDLVAQVIGAA